MEGTDAAWDNADYHFTFESLRKDFDIDSRYRDLSVKIGVVKEDTRFFVEMLQSNQSERLEKIIILLIFSEIVMNLCHVLDPQYLNNFLRMFV